MKLHRIITADEPDMISAKNQGTCEESYDAEISVGFRNGRFAGGRDRLGWLP